jgi:hypothetical protein
MSTWDTSVDPDAFNAFEAAGWETRAEDYHRHLGAMTAPVIEPLLDAAAVGHGTRILDVATVCYRHRLAGAGELWEAHLLGAVRFGAMLRGQPEPTRARIRDAFDRLVQEHAVDGGAELPVSVKLAAGRRP